jgi:hypothetical protein
MYEFVNLHFVEVSLVFFKLLDCLSVGLLLLIKSFQKVLTTEESIFFNLSFYVKSVKFIKIGKTKAAY